MDFYVPKHLIQDYKDFLQTAACKTIKYCRDILVDNPVWVEERVEISGLNSKSKQYSSDNALKMSMAFDTNIQKGDMIDYNGKLYLTTWQINEDYLNAKHTTIELLPSNLTFKRYTTAIANNITGELIQASGYNSVFPTIRCTMVVNGNYDARLSSGQVGLFPNNRLTISVQANSKTLGLKLDDVFSFHGNTHIIRDILYNELNYDGSTGILILHVEKTVLDGVE